MNAVELGQSLREAFAQVPDPRSAHGRRHPLAAMLALATAAMLSNAHSLYAIAQWGRLQPPEVVHALGFTRDRTPSVSSLHLVFTRLDVEALETALARWAQAHLGAGGAVIAIDGKALRGSHGKDPAGGWVDVVAAYAHEAGQVLAQAGGPGR